MPLTKAEEAAASCTREEFIAARNRILEDASNRLAFGPVQAFGAGCATVFGLGCLEGSIYLLPPNRFSLEGVKFMFRYGLANVIPSLIWGKIEANTIISALNMSAKILHQHLPPRSDWHQNRLQSLRGAIAGSLVISQVFSLAQVATQAKDGFSQRLCDGREPPLNDPNQEEVVIRLSGETSDVTSLGFERDGRRKYFPIFENSSNAQTQQLVRRFGLGVGDYGVPVFWQVDDGQYGHSDSWRGMSIPHQWLFRKKISKQQTWGQADRVLILEADALNGKSMSIWGLLDPKEVGEFDLDLYEAAQGFSRLRSLVSRTSRKYDLLRVLLVDADAIVKSGGGRVETVREYVTNLGLSDVIIDARAPLVYSINRWLGNRTLKEYSTWGLGFFRLYIRKEKPVILETPCTSSFNSIKSALGELGYSVMDMSLAKKRFGSLHNIPVLIYEKNTHGTINTVDLLLERGLVKPQDVCALCLTHHGLIELKDGQISNITTICGSDLYDNLFRLVRNLAAEGFTPAEIQLKLDRLFCPEASDTSFMKHRLGFPTTNSQYQ